MNTNELKEYFQNKLGWGTGYQSNIVFRFLLDAAKHAEGGVILDAGAGAQRYKYFFEDAIYLAQEHPVAGALNKGIIEYDILSDVKEIPLADNSVDVVLSTSSLEHMEFPTLFFSEAHRVLKPGGSLFINVPFIYYEHEVPYDFQRLTRYGLRRDYQHAGFDKILIEPTSSSIFTASFFFLECFLEEIARIKGLDKNTKNSQKRILLKFVYLFAKLFTAFILRTCDRGPHKSTKFPIGWVAKGYKLGASEKKHISKEGFVKNYARLTPNIIVQNGRIINTAK